MLRFEICHDLDGGTLEAILGLIELNTRVDGHSPVGEHKQAHLRVGARDWTGILAWDSDGGLKGYAHTRWNPPGQRPRMTVEVVVHPDARGDGAVARELIRELRRVLADEGGGCMWLWVHHVQEPRDTLAYDMGFDIQRELAFMVLDMPERPVTRPLREGLVIRPYRPDVDDAAFLAVNNAAFEGHPENGGWDEAELMRRRAFEWFDPEGLLMAWRDGTCVGFHWTKWHGHDTDAVPAHEPVGEVYVLAVHPQAQGLGLGRTLLTAGLSHLWDAGCRRAILYVDRASEGPVKLYTAAGFTVAHSEVCYETEVPPAAGVAAV